jgi:hypothetical protein
MTKDQEIDFIWRAARLMYAHPKSGSSDSFEWCVILAERSFNELCQRRGIEVSEKRQAMQ